MHIVYISLKSLSSDTGLLSFSKSGDQKLDTLRHSLTANGLLNPLRVTPHKKKFLVVDGKKRLKAIKLLARTGAQSFSKIPCVIDTFDSSINTETAPKDRPALLSAAELAHLILTQVRKSVPLNYIAQRYECDMHVVRKCLRLPGLHVKVLKAFYDGTISLEQASALSHIPNPKAQWNLLLQLGPFASDRRILKAIINGETVLDLPDGNTIILPSRLPTEISEFDSPTHNRFHKETIAA